MRGTEPRRQPHDVALIVTLPDGQTRRFSTPFHIGREQDCEIQIADVHVSRRHAEVSRVRGQWTIRDLQSSNGLFVDGERVDIAPIGERVTITFGADGPTLQIEPENISTRDAAPAATTEDTSLDAYAQRYFASEDDEPVGGRTLMIRKAFQKVQREQKRKHRWTIAVAGLLAIGAGGYALYAYRIISTQKKHAEAMFYRMKEQDVIFAALEHRLAQLGSAPEQQQIAQYIAQRREMERDYESYVASLYDRRLNEKERLILRVTRLFGECDVAAPAGYTREVTRFIGQWQRTGRFVSALKRAQQAGYTPKIVAELQAQNLPPQYFYLAMQESDFIPTRSGPPTRWGIAKGMWQFIPETGRRFGLKTGPFEREDRYDPHDDRLDWAKATEAAAKYIKEIYSTDAQASGLLVMASYNWGEHRVIDLVRKMPLNPRERNFWKFLEHYSERMPEQTYNYVFSIVSAAVIGENPRLFGFDFDNPLASAAQR